MKSDKERRSVIFKVIETYLTNHPDKVINVYYRYNRHLFLPIVFAGGKPKLLLDGRRISFNDAARNYFGPKVGSYDTSQNAYIFLSFLHSEIEQIEEFRAVKFKLNKAGFCDKINYFASDYETYLRDIAEGKIAKPQSQPPLPQTAQDKRVNDVVPTIPTTIRPTDYVEQAIRNEEIGSAGEELVLHNEKEHLISIGKKELADKVAKQPDGLGFDILSFHNDGNKKFIEVKTTTGKFDSPFFITENELDFMRNNSANYFLYRVYNFDTSDQDGDVRVLSGSDLDELEFTSKVYSCTPQL